MIIKHVPSRMAFEDKRFQRLGYMFDVFLLKHLFS